MIKFFRKGPKMKHSATKKIISLLLISGMLISSAHVALADGAQIAQSSAEETLTESETSPDKDRDLIERAASLANGTHIYYPDMERKDIAVQNKTMSLKYGLSAGSGDIYLKNLSNTRGETYIENTFDVFVDTADGNRFYASDSMLGAKVNVYRYGYYYYENRIEGQVFASDITPDENYTYDIDLSAPYKTNAISKYVSNSDGSAYFISSSTISDVYFCFNTTDSSGNPIDTQNYDFVEIKVKAESVSTSGQIFIISGDATKYSPDQSTSFNLIDDGEWHVYRIPLSGIKNFTGKLKNIRFDIEAKPDTRVDIEYARIFKAKYTGISPNLSIQRSFLSYSDKLHHLTQLSAANEIDGILNVGVETKIEQNRVVKLTVKDKYGLQTSIDSVDWSSAEYVGFDIADAGIFGYILPADGKSGSIEVTLADGYYILTQSLPIEDGKISPSDKGSRNANDIFFGQRIYNDEGHDFADFIHEAECERHPLTKENIIVDFNEEGSSFSGYDALYGFYKFAISGAGFNDSYYDYPNRHFNVRFTVKGDDLDRKMYFMTRCLVSGGLESAVLLNDDDMILPIPLEVAKNFSGDGENTIYNIDDASYGETFFPIIANSGEERTYNLVNIYQNWGRFPLKQISSIQFFTPYYHLSTGVTETNCITLFTECGPTLPDHRAMSAPFWTGQPQHNSGGAHTFLRYVNADGMTVTSQNTTASIDSHGPTYADITLGFITADGKISAEYTHTEMPQLDENRGYYELRYTFNEDVSFKDFAREFTFYRVTDNNGTGVYEYVGYLDRNNNCQVADAVDTAEGRSEYILGKDHPYFSFFCMPNWNRQSGSAQGYTNLSMLFKDWTVVSCGEEIETELFLINTKDYLTLSMNVGEISFKAGDTISINAILMPWGSQQMEDDPLNRLNNAQTAIYDSPHYSDPLPDGTLYMDKNVRDVRANTLLNPLTATAVENADVIDSPFVPKLKSTNGKSATFTVSGGYDNNTVRIYGFDKLTVPYIEEYVNGEWVEYAVSSKNTPDKLGYGHNYDGYMAHYDPDGSYSYSFVFNMTDKASRTFRISAEKDFSGWQYNPNDAKESPMNVLVGAEKIFNSASESFFEDKVLSEDGSYTRLYLRPERTNDAGETVAVNESYINLYSGGTHRVGGKYIVYKYRIPTSNSKKSNLQFWTSTKNTGAGGNDFITIESSAIEADGNWHVMVVDVTTVKNADCTFEKNGYGVYCPKYLRIDSTNSQMSSGDYLDISYVGFSDSIPEIIAANSDVDCIELINKDKKSYTAISTETYKVPESSANLSLESASVHAGDKLTLKLNVSNNKGLSFLRVIPKYNAEVFTLKGVMNGQVIDNMSQKDGSFIWNSTEDSAKNGTLATFTFDINEGADLGKYSIDLLVVDTASNSVSEYTVSVTDSTPNIIGHPYGDSNGDNVVNSLDVIALRKYFASYDYTNGVAGSEIYDGADANGDGYVNTGDITALRQYLAGYDYDSGITTAPLGRQ